MRRRLQDVSALRVLTLVRDEAPLSRSSHMTALIQPITTELLERTVERAKASPRLRTNHNFHPGNEANPQRFLNALVYGTYVTPHRHVSPPKAEAFLVLSGTLAFFTFHDDGRIASLHLLGEQGNLGIDVAAGVWHSMAVLSETAVIYEVKPGPYAPSDDKDFAGFAPREGAAGAAEYLEELLENAEKARQARASHA